MCRPCRRSRAEEPARAGKDVRGEDRRDVRRVGETVACFRFTNSVFNEAKSESSLSSETGRSGCGVGAECGGAEPGEGWQRADGAVGAVAGMLLMV